MADTRRFVRSQAPLDEVAQGSVSGPALLNFRAGAAEVIPQGVERAAPTQDDGANMQRPDGRVDAHSDDLPRRPDQGLHPAHRGGLGAGEPDGGSQDHDGQLESQPRSGDSLRGLRVRQRVLVPYDRPVGARCRRHPAERDDQTVGLQRVLRVHRPAENAGLRDHLHHSVSLGHHAVLGDQRSLQPGGLIGAARLRPIQDPDHQDGGSHTDGALLRRKRQQQIGSCCEATYQD